MQELFLFTYLAKLILKIKKAESYIISVIDNVEIHLQRCSLVHRKFSMLEEEKKASGCGW